MNFAKILKHLFYRTSPVAACVSSKVNKLTVVLQKLQTDLPRHSLSIIYKPFGRVHLDYSNIIYDKNIGPILEK